VPLHCALSTLSISPEPEWVSIPVNQLPKDNSKVLVIVSNKFTKLMGKFCIYNNKGMILTSALPLFLDSLDCTRDSESVCLVLLSSVPVSLVRTIQ